MHVVFTRKNLRKRKAIGRTDAVRTRDWNLQNDFTKSPTVCPLLHFKRGKWSHRSSHRNTGKDGAWPGSLPLPAFHYDDKTPEAHPELASNSDGPLIVLEPGQKYHVSMTGRLFSAPVATLLSA